MNRVLVPYASKHGATAEIAKAIAEGLTRRGVDAAALPAETPEALDSYDGVVVGSAVYPGHWLKPARRLVEVQAEAFAARPVWLLSSGPPRPSRRAEAGRRPGRRGRPRHADPGP